MLRSSPAALLQPPPAAHHNHRQRQRSAFNPRVCVPPAAWQNKPEELVNFVAASKSRASRADKADMLLMTDVTTKWMSFMIEKNFPPLTPHHTQAFTVMMMSRFFGDHLDPNREMTKAEAKAAAKMKLKAFVAQLATGEGKSIVIAMLAIFMVKLYGLKVPRTAFEDTHVHAQMHPATLDRGPGPGSCCCSPCSCLSTPRALGT